jgi:predicted metal-dependent hydrolase
MPKRCSLDEAGSFLHRHLDWVHECIDDIPDRVVFEHGALVPLRGVTHKLFFTGAPRAREIVKTQAGEPGEPPRLAVSGLLEHAPRRFQDWMVEQARRDLGKRVQVHAQNLSLRPKRFSIRDQSTRWGSCSSSGCLSFSWRLIMAPSVVLDYLAAHEVAHLAEMNHGARFWQLVEQTMPQMNEAKDWLRREGMDLHRYSV